MLRAPDRSVTEIGRTIRGCAPKIGGALTDFREAVRALGYSITDGPFVDGSDTVYRGRSLATDDEVALRFVRPGFDSDRFHREAAILTTFQHPGIANLREHKVVAGWSMLVLDWIEGETLERFMERRGPISSGEALHLIEQLAAALDSLHSAGIVHPDLGPRSIVSIAKSGPRPDLKIIDLAISRGGDAAENTTAPPPKPKSGSYCAPELKASGQRVPQTDQFVIAAVAHELITGFSPFAAGDYTPTPIRSVKPAVSKSFESALLKALSEKPEDRFPTMSEFIVAARGKKEKVAAPAADTSKQERGRSAKADKAATEDNKRKAKKTDGDSRSVSNEFLKAAAAIVLGVLIGVGGFLAFFNGDDEPATREFSAPEEPFEPLAGTGEDAVRIEIDDWEAGQAGSIECNAVTAFDFEDGTIPTNFYRDPSNPGREQIVVGAGVDGSAALEIGDPGGAGTYGEVIAVDGETSYLFSLNFNIAGEVPEAQVSIEWLDENRELIAESDVLNLVERTDGQHALITQRSPAETAFAVPRIHKSAGPGLLFVDELVLVPTESDCTRAILS